MRGTGQRRRWSRPRADLVELAGGDVEDEPAQRFVFGDERAGLDAAQRLTHVLFQIGERLGGPLRLDAGLVLDGALELVVGEGQHAAVGVVDQDDLVGAEQPLADRQRADLVVGDDAAGVADDVRLALGQAEDPVDVEPGVHARHHRDVLARRQRQRAREGARVRLVVLQILVGHRHWDLLAFRGHTSDDNNRGGPATTENHAMVGISAGLPDRPSDQRDWQVVDRGAADVGSG